MWATPINHLQQIVTELTAIRKELGHFVDQSIIASMKRLTLSLLGGFLLPFLYSVIVGPLTPYIKNNSTLDFLAMVPVRWPILILQGLHVFPFESELGALLYIISCNVVFYGSLMYVVLFALSKLKKTSPLPPAPDNTWTSVAPNSRFQNSD